MTLKGMKTSNQRSSENQTKTNRPPPSDRAVSVGHMSRSAKSELIKPNFAISARDYDAVASTAWSWQRSFLMTPFRS